MARLTERFPHTLSLVFDPARTADDPDVSYAGRLAGRSDQEIAEDFVAHVRGAGPTTANGPCCGTRSTPCAPTRPCGRWRGEAAADHRDGEPR